MSQRVYIVRHPEKQDSDHLSVGESGVEDINAPSVPGWQRIGAYPHVLDLRKMKIKQVFAGFRRGSSHRMLDEAEQMGRFYGVPVDREFAPTDNAALARALKAAKGNCLLVDEHGNIPLLLAEFGIKFPPWPDDCFNVMVELRRSGKRWRGRQKALVMLPGDKKITIK